MDDLFVKKKETAPILDLSRATANSKEEFRRLFDRVPDFKIKPEKVRPEDAKVKDKKLRFKTGKKDFRAMKQAFDFMDPLPLEMKNIKLDDVATVAIDWRMLMTVRPKLKAEEDMFSRLVDLRKLEIKTVAQDKRSFAVDSQVRKIKNRSGVTEMRPISCPECNEDFCNGKVCTLLNYDSFARVQDVVSVKVVSKSASEDTTKKKKKIKRRTRPKQRKGKRSKSRSKSPKKEASKK